jgi:hypothetical protein
MPETLYIQVSHITYQVEYIGVVVTQFMFFFPSKTDVKPENVLFTDGVATETIQKLLDHTPQAVDGEFELEGRHYPVIRSQPIPHPFRWNDPGIVVERYSVCLTDFSNGKHCLCVLQAQH